VLNARFTQPASRQGVECQDAGPSRSDLRIVEDHRDSLNPSDNPSKIDRVNFKNVKKFKDFKKKKDEDNQEMLASFGATRVAATMVAPLFEPPELKHKQEYLAMNSSPDKSTRPT